MPVIVRRQGFAVAIRHPPREHGPAHVHVVSGNGECEFWIRRDAVTVKSVHAMRASDVRRALRIVADNLDLLHEEWTKRHGKNPRGK